MSDLRQRGFTLVELVLFMVVIGAGLAGILLVMNTVVKSSADPLVGKQAMAIAESLLEEILLKDYENPAGGDTGTVRAQFDDVDQYMGYTSTGIKDPLGVDIPSLSRYSVSPAVSVVPTALGGVAVKAITVSVTSAQGTIALTGYRANY